MSNKKVHLILGVHNHQPVDNWDHVIEDAYVKCYKPFLDVLAAHPKVGMSVHYTGYLLDWIADKHPELIDQLKHLIARGQVELFTGGYYEPVLAIIPDADKVVQIRRLTGRIQELTGAHAKGMWLAERVWEPHLVKFIAEAGVDYFCVDDAHFKAVGLSDDDLFGRYISEEQGKTADIFPVSKDMRYHIPYSEPHKVIDYLVSQATDDGKRVVVYFDDGEKFGVWPGTYQSVFEERWLDRFFQALEDASDIIHTVTPQQYVKEVDAIGRIYLPTASYSEMQEWALPAREVNTYEALLHESALETARFLRGGFWRHFLVKYPEANNIHKKMLHVSRKVERAKDKLSAADAARMQDHLWRGQSNDIFWHGVFGGLYLTNLRTANYQHLLQAEQLADAVLEDGNHLRIQQCDFNADGQNEVLIESHHQNIYLAPSEGGAMFELDYRPRHFNLLDTLCRRYEPYHDKLSKAVFEGDEDPAATEAKSIHDRIVTKERNLEQYLHYDWHRRLSLVDHFFGPGTSLEALYAARYPEQGDFVSARYNAHVHDQQVILEREGHVWIGDWHAPVHVKKVLTPDAHCATLQIDYTITNRSDGHMDLWFAPEFNVNLLAPDAPDRYYYVPQNDEPGHTSGGCSSRVGLIARPSDTRIAESHMVSQGVLHQLPAIGLVDEWQKINYQLWFEHAADVWRFPIHTISQSEAGFEKVYQSSAIYPNWHFHLDPNASWHVRITQCIETF